MKKNITLSADDWLIQKARKKAQHEHVTLNQRFREWLLRYISLGRNSDEIEDLFKELNYADPGKKFTRDEMNER